MGHWRSPVRDQRPVARRSPAGAGGWSPRCEIAHLKPLQYDQKFSPERHVQNTLEVALERQPAAGGLVSEGAERASDHVPDANGAANQQHVPAHRAA